MSRRSRRKSGRPQEMADGSGTRGTPVFRLTVKGKENRLRMRFLRCTATTLFRPRCRRQSPGWKSRDYTMFTFTS